MVKDSFTFGSTTTSYKITLIKKDYLVEKVNIQKLVHAEIKELQAWCMQKEIGFEIDLSQEEVLTDKNG